MTRAPRCCFALLLCCAAPACRDQDPDLFDAAALALRLDQAFAPLSANAGVQSVRVLAGAFSWSGAAPPVAAAPGAPGDPAALFPPGAAGRTFEYDPTSAVYRASDRPGAPATAVRFALYATDNAPLRVRIPLLETGILELTDKTSPAGATLGARAELAGQTLFDYDATGSFSTAGLTFTAHGYAVAGAARLDFQLSQLVSGTTGVEVEYRVSAPAQQLSLTLVGSAQPGTNLSGSTLSVAAGDDQLEIDASAVGEVLTGTVKHNGRTLASFSGTGDDPAFTGQNGRVLTDADLQGLKTMLQFVDRMLEGFDDLLVPAYFVFGLSR